MFSMPMCNKNLRHTGDTKEADNPIDNVMCQDILINVIFGCEFGGLDFE